MRARGALGGGGRTRVQAPSPNFAISRPRPAVVPSMLWREAVIRFSPRLRWMTYAPPGRVTRVFLLILFGICNAFVVYESLDWVCDTLFGTGTGIRHSVGSGSVGVPPIKGMMDIQMTDTSGDRQPTLIVCHDKGRVGQWSRHRELSREVKRSGPLESGRGQVLFPPEFCEH